jgi:hypothetical protein
VIAANTSREKPIVGETVRRIIPQGTVFFLSNDYLEFYPGPINSLQVFQLHIQEGEHGADASRLAALAATTSPKNDRAETKLPCGLSLISASRQSLFSEPCINLKTAVDAILRPLSARGCTNNCSALQ